jgi:CRISPR-associated endonuclease/helicase Cas3
MRGVPTTFWGKLRQRGDASTLEWHPLFDHCADVAAVTEALLGLPVWTRRMSSLAGRPLGELDGARLCVLAALHDVGKLNLGFQAHGRPGLGPQAGHVGEPVAALTRGRPLASLGCLGVWGESTGLLLLSSICHHGRPLPIEATAAD